MTGSYYKILKVTNKDFKFMPSQINGQNIWCLFGNDAISLLEAVYTKSDKKEYDSMRELIDVVSKNKPNIIPSVEDVINFVPALSEASEYFENIYQKIYSLDINNDNEKKLIQEYNRLQKIHIKKLIDSQDYSASMTDSLDIRKLKSVFDENVFQILSSGKKNRSKISFINKEVSDKTSVVGNGFTFSIIAVYPKSLRSSLYSKGFTLYFGGEQYEYVRYKRSASSARNGKCLFILKDLLPYMQKWGNCGLTEPSPDASWESYISLTLSGIEKDTIVLPKRSILIMKDAVSRFTTLSDSESLSPDNFNNLFITVDKDNKPCSYDSKLIYPGTGKPTYFDYLPDLSDPDADEILSSIETQLKEDGYPENINLREEIQISTFENKIWDGESMLDDSIFTNSNAFCNAHMLLLRARFFKSCAFRTNLQKWFLYNNIDTNAFAEDVLNGYTLTGDNEDRVRVSEIRLVTTESSLKYLKFTENPSDICAGLNKWLNNHDGDNIEFGIVKTDHVTEYIKEGKSKVLTSYQFLNTFHANDKEIEDFLISDVGILEKQPARSNIKENTTNDSCISYKYYIKKIQELYNCPDKLKEYLLDVDRITHESSDEDDRALSESANTSMSEYQLQRKAILNIINWFHDDCKYLPFYQQFVDKEAQKIRTRLKSGEIQIDGLFCVLFGNPLEFLYATIHKDYVPNLNNAVIPPMYINDSYGNPDMGQKIDTIRHNDIYTKYYKNNEELCAIRYPHITMGNVLYTINKSNRFIDDFFDLGPAIVCVNSICTNLPDRLNGADFDSDQVLITNNPFFYTQAKDLVRFPLPVNRIENETNSGVITLDQIDSSISDNRMGEIVNLATLYNGYFWDKTLSEYCPDELIKSIYNDYLCHLEVYSNLEIDKAKRKSIAEYNSTITDLKDLRSKFRVVYGLNVVDDEVIDLAEIDNSDKYFDPEGMGMMDYPPYYRDIVLNESNKSVKFYKYVNSSANADEYNLLLYCLDEPVYFMKYELPSKTFYTFDALIFIMLESGGENELVEYFILSNLINHLPGSESILKNSFDTLLKTFHLTKSEYSERIKSKYLNRAMNNEFFILCEDENLPEYNFNRAKEFITKTVKKISKKYKLGIKDDEIIVYFPSYNLADYAVMKSLWKYGTSRENINKLICTDILHIPELYAEECSQIIYTVKDHLDDVLGRYSLYKRALDSLKNIDNEINTPYEHFYHEFLPAGTEYLTKKHDYYLKVLSDNDSVKRNSSVILFEFVHDGRTIKPIEINDHYSLIGNVYDFYMENIAGSTQKPEEISKAPVKNFTELLYVDNPFGHAYKEVFRSGKDTLKEIKELAVNYQKEENRLKLIHREIGNDEDDMTSNLISEKRKEFSDKFQQLIDRPSNVKLTADGSMHQEIGIKLFIYELFALIDDAYSEEKNKAKKKTGRESNKTFSAKSLLATSLLTCEGGQNNVAEIITQMLSASRSSMI